MKTITLSLGTVFITSNNFGDQCIELKTFSGYQAFRTNYEGEHESFTTIKRWAMNQMRLRPLAERDVVRVIDSGITGVVCKVRDQSICLVPTKDNPYGIGVWYHASNLKRIGRAVSRVY